MPRKDFPVVQSTLLPVLQNTEYRVKPFRSLPLEVKKALLEYDPTAEAFRFGVVRLPTRTITSLIMELSPSWNSFEQYHRWYTSIHVIPDYPEDGRWPIVLSRNDAARDFPVIEDGWHRFHDYYRKGAKEIPCVFYTEKRR